MAHSLDALAASYLPHPFAAGPGWRSGRVRRRALLAAIFLASFSLSVAAQTFDEDAAVSLAKKSGCLKCHSIEKRKKAPSYKEIAAKFRSKADAEAVLIKHLTEAPVVKTEDGDDESHAQIKSDNREEILNVVRWVLSR